MNWMILGVLAAVFWGIEYATQEHLMKDVPAPALALSTSLGISLALLLFSYWFPDKMGIQAIPALVTSSNAWWMLVVILSGAAASILVLMAIEGGTATTASLIEISYPLFVCFFSYAIFGRTELNPKVVVGAFLILGGVYLVLLGSPRKSELREEQIARGTVLSHPHPSGGAIAHSRPSTSAPLETMARLPSWSSVFTSES